MSRLQTKCLAASAVSHGMLLVLVVVGSAFVPQKPVEEAPPFEHVDLSALLVEDDLAGGGGNPNVRQMPAVPPQQPVIQQPVAQPLPQPSRPAPQPQQPEPVKEQEVKPPPRRPDPEPRREPVKPERSQPEEKPEKAESPKYDNDRFNLKNKTTVKPKEKPKPVFDLGSATKRKIITSNSNSKNSDDSSNADEAAASKQREALLAARQGIINGALKNIQSGVSGSTAVDVPGPGGRAYAGYGVYLKKVYEEAWIPPAAARDNEPVVEVEVTISRDGTVLARRILKKSGRSALDQSVNETLNRVKKVRAFPEGSTDAQRTFRINFNLSTKLQVG